MLTTHTNFLQWQETPPHRKGWYWRLMRGHAVIVLVEIQPAYGNRFCCVLDERCVPVDDCSNTLWSGPIPYPSEP